MPPEALRLVASHLSPDDVLNTLLLVRPSFFEDLRNGVAWPKLDHWNLVEHARHVMLASADTVRLLWIDYSPVGRHVTEKWQRVALGKELKTIVVENVDLVKGKRFSSSVNELRYEFPAPSDEEYGTVLWKNVWDDFLPSAPAPIIESVSVGLSRRVRWHRLSQPGAMVECLVALGRGDSFFRAFPHATSLKFKARPHKQFFDQPASAMSNVRELSIFFNYTYGREQNDVVFPFLDRMKNLTMLELLGCSALGEQLESLPQDYVHESLRTLRINVDAFDKLKSLWDAIPRQFPRLTALHLETSLVQPHGHFDLNSLMLAPFKRLESITLKGFDVPLSVALDLCACATVTSVVCHSVSRRHFIVTDDETLKMAELRDAPGCRVDFHLANREERSSMGRFRFAFSRSE
jgi:hypothetical protein